MSMKVTGMKRSAAAAAACLCAGAFLHAETYPTAGGDMAIGTNGNGSGVIKCWPVLAP